MRLGFSLLLAQGVVVLRTSLLCASSGLVHCFCLFAPNHDQHELDHHTENLASIGSVRFAEASASSPSTKSKKT